MQKEMQGNMTVPATVERREVIIGSGPAAATYVATRRAMGFPRPIVLEKNRTLGGVFATTINFGMNSANLASLASTASPGPTRIEPMSPTDDQNLIPNSLYQVRDAGIDEYPHSFDMAKTVRRTLQEYAETYTEADLLYDSGGLVATREGFGLGRATRIIFAGGLVEPAGIPQNCKAIMSGYAFLKRPVRDLRGLKIALLGNGATAASIAEFALGMGLTKPTSYPTNIHWYGGPTMPLSKLAWMSQYHARFAELGRHFPQENFASDVVAGGPIRPFSVQGQVVPAGDIAMVNGQVFDLVIMATGFDTAPCLVPMTSEIRIGGLCIARGNSPTNPLGSRVFKIGTAAKILEAYGPYQSRFDAAILSLSNQLPRVAALAAALPR